MEICHEHDATSSMACLVMNWSRLGLASLGFAQEPKSASQRHKSGGPAQVPHSRRCLARKDASAVLALSTQGATVMMHP